MRTTTRKQVEIIQADSAAEFQTRLNAVLAKHPAAEIEWNHGKGFCAYVVYTYEEDQPDEVSDIFHMEGIHYFCRNCPYMEPPQDKRFKRCGCSISPHGSTHMDSEACDFLYKSLLTGAIKHSELRFDIKGTEKHFARWEE